MKLFVGNIKSNKFMNNIVLNDIRDMQIVSGNYRGKLYGIHQQQKINSYIFDAEFLDKELFQFILQYNNHVKIFLYHRILNKELIEKVPCYHLLHEEYDIGSCIKIPSLVNSHIFYNHQNNNRSSKDFVCFLDSIDGYNELNSLLYPNSNFAIKIYGSQKSHQQNLGTVSEKDKAELLNSHKNYLDLDGLYTNEAVACGCDIYTLESIKNNTIINIKNDTNYESYESFLYKILT